MPFDANIHVRSRMYISSVWCSLKLGPTNILTTLYGTRIWWEQQCEGHCQWYMHYCTCSETWCMGTIEIACDRNQLAYCSHSKAHNFAQESSIEKIKAPLWSAINALSDGVLISVSTNAAGGWFFHSRSHMLHNVHDIGRYKTWSVLCSMYSLIL